MAWSSSSRRRQLSSRGNRWQLVCDRLNIQRPCVFRGVFVAFLIFFVSWNVFFVRQLSFSNVRWLRFPNDESEESNEILEKDQLHLAPVISGSGSIEYSKFWFLDPELYAKEDGCDFTHLVENFQPEQLEIHCGNVHLLELEKNIGQGFWRHVYKATWKGAVFVFVACSIHLVFV
jgi:hypothetical protein